ncbi:MAG: PAS domain-containing protein [Pirellulaceae bacterium]
MARPSCCELCRTGEDGVSGIVLTLIDVATLKQAEAEVRENAEWMQTILDTTTEGIYGVDMDGNCTFCNDAALRLLGYENENQVLAKHARPGSSFAFRQVVLPNGGLSHLSCASRRNDHARGR